MSEPMIPTPPPILREHRRAERAARAHRDTAILSLVAVIAIALLWLYPPAGFVLAVGLLVVAPPVGRSYAERGIVTGIVLLGVIALAFPRGSNMPITPASAFVLLSLAVVIAVGTRAGSRTPLALPRLTDLLLLALIAASSLWLMSAYFGASPEGMLSGLFFSGWDNQGHFLPFANTVEAGSLHWPTADGSMAWNQWYPAVHTAAWSLAEVATQLHWINDATIDRTTLLFPFVRWTALSFALSMTILAWIAADIAERVAHIVHSAQLRRYAPPIAVLGFSAFALFGSPALLFNAGFTNFVMGVAVAAGTSYIAARAWRNARRIGWLIVPLGTTAVVGLWTPLALGIVPAGIIVLVALFRSGNPDPRIATPGRTPRRAHVLAVGWAVATIALVGGTAYLQSRAIVDTGVPGSSGSFFEDLGAVGNGMSPFNMGVAIVAPVIAVLAAVIVARRGHRATAIAIAGASVGIAAFVPVALWGADQAGLSRLNSYYVLKSLNALLLVGAPVIMAVAALVVVVAIAAVRLATSRARTGRIEAGLVAAMAGLLGVAVFGYVGVVPASFTDGFAAAPGIRAASVRAGGVSDHWVGVAVIRAQQALQATPAPTSMLWDGSGTLPNLWLASLRGPISINQHAFYRNLPAFPYDQSTVDYIDLSLRISADLDLAVAWFRPSSGEIVDGMAAMHPDRVTSVQVPMESNPLCPECVG